MWGAGRSGRPGAEAGTWPVAAEIKGSGCILDALWERAGGAGRDRPLGSLAVPGTARGGRGAGRGVAELDAQTHNMKSCSQLGWLPRTAMVVLLTFCTFRVTYVLNFSVAVTAESATQFRDCTARSGSRS